MTNTIGIRLIRPLTLLYFSLQTIKAIVMTEVTQVAVKNYFFFFSFSVSSAGCVFIGEKVLLGLSVIRSL